MPGGIAFDRVAEEYDATRSLPPGVERAVAERLARRIGAERTLELGVGTGRWACPLQQLTVAITGVDLSAPMLRVARRKGLVRAIRADASRLPFPDDQFDGALSNHLLHLVYDVPAVLREIGRVCRGRLRSVLEHETARPDLVEAYLRLVREGDAGRPPPGLGERRLAETLRPDAVRDAARFHSRGPASTKLDAIARRSFRDTWGTPERLHRSAVEALRRTFAEQDELVETRVEIVEWSRDRLLAFAAEYARPSMVPRGPNRPNSRRAGKRPPGASVTPK